MTPIVVRSEQEAFELLEAALAGKVGPWSDLRFEGWPNLTIYLKGKQFDQTITTSVMRSLLDLQSDINQAYAAARHGDPGKRLTDAERSALELKVKVAGGSTHLSVDVQALAVEFIKQTAGKLTPME
ncbi:MAG: hypothetical protein O9335_08810 [Inhella sp.]|nr:hypothetical protein [Inhella sp.]